jgi:hypothetical protein
MKAIRFNKLRRLRSGNWHGLDWRIASKSGGGNCVEIAKFDDSVAFRHSRRPDAEVIVYSLSEFDAFIDGAKRGEFDDMLK